MRPDPASDDFFSRHEAMKAGSQLAWIAAGCPEHPYRTVPRPHATCAVCAAEMHDGVLITEVETATTSAHADLFRFGGDCVCHACAWLFAAGKGRPGNFLATPAGIEYLAISQDSVTGKRPWSAALREIASLPPDTPMTGVMTTDVKPRLWPKARLATVADAGLYVHAAEYDVSAWVNFDLRACVELIDALAEIMRAGYSKASIYHGLLRDYARVKRNPGAAMAWERMLSAHRSQPHFLPALIASGVTKETR